MAAPVLVGIVVGLLTSAAIPAGTLSAAGIGARDAAIILAVDRDAAALYGELPAICAASKRFRARFARVCAVSGQANTPIGRTIAIVKLIESGAPAPAPLYPVPPRHGK